MGHKHLASIKWEGRSHAEYFNHNAINLDIDNTNIARQSPNI